MSKVYEIDPDADTLVIVSAHRAPQTNGQLVPSKRTRHSDSGTDTPLHVVNGTDKSLPGDLRIKTSSKHLSLASRPLRNKLSQADGNSPSVKFDGRVHLRIEGFDPVAVTIILNAIHGKSSRLPKSVDLETLVKIASFVQTFQCHDALEVYAERWITRLQGTTVGLTRYTAQTASWIFVSYVFRQPDLFNSVTRLALSRGPALVPQQHLRIPDSITNKIENSRQQLIGKVVSLLHELVTDLHDGHVSCVMGCDLLLLGTLVRALHQWNLSKPYSGISFSAISRSLRELQDQVWYAGAPAPTKPADVDKTPVTLAASAVGGRKDRLPAHFCGIRSLINPRLYSLEVSIDGLDLDDVLGS